MEKREREKERVTKKEDWLKDTVNEKKKYMI